MKNLWISTQPPCTFSFLSHIAVIEAADIEAVEERKSYSSCNKWTSWTRVQREINFPHIYNKCFFSLSCIKACHWMWMWPEGIVLEEENLEFKSTRKFPSCVIIVEKSFQLFAACKQAFNIDNNRLVSNNSSTERIEIIIIDFFMVLWKSVCGYNKSSSIASLCIVGDW